LDSGDFVDIELVLTRLDVENEELPAVASIDDSADLLLV